jgi:hypothetical protein
VQKKSSKTAFSIIELSVVAIIISALIGGVVAAKRLTQNSKLVAARSLTKNSPVNDIDGLVVWYETTMPQSFDENADDNNTQISTWYDLGPNKNNATSGGGATYTENVLNGLPILRFNGSSSYFNFDGTPLASSNYTVIAVEIRTSTKSLNYFVSGGNSSKNRKPHLGYRNNTSLTFAQYGNDYDVAVLGYTSPIPRIHVFRFNSAVGKTLHVNGSELINQTTSNAKTGLVSYNNAQIGRYGSYYEGDIAEIIIFNKHISDNERKDIEQYLSKKWGIKIS